MREPVATAFYFDLASPLAWLAAERVLHVLPGPAQWRPALARELGPQPHDGAGGAAAQALREHVERRAAELGTLPLRWPEPFPFDSRRAMLAAAYAASIGRAVPFALAAFRQAFAGGRSLQETDSIVIAAAACEMHPAAVVRALDSRSAAARLASATAAAAAAGVRELPAIVVGEEAYQGEHAPELAREAIAAAGGPE